MISKHSHYIYRDDLLSLNEFMVICRALFRNDKGHVYIVPDEQIEQIFNVFDTNHDEFIDRNEFQFCWNHWIKTVNNWIECIVRFLVVLLLLLYTISILVYENSMIVLWIQENSAKYCVTHGTKFTTSIQKSHKRKYNLHWRNFPLIIESTMTQFYYFEL